MSKILIVDDEDLARLRLRRFFEAKHPTFSIAEAIDGVDAIEKIPVFQPDIIFMDIEMPEMSGFDVLLHLETRPFSIVFQTAFDQFAVKAFDENACDYILKPFSDERLESALQKALKTRSSANQLDKHLVASQRYLTKIIIRVGNKQKILEASDIRCFTSESHVTRVFLASIDYACDHSLTFLEERLNPDEFIRTHRNSIVRLSSVKSIENGPNMTVTLDTGAIIPVSRENRRRVLDALRST